MLGALLLNIPQFNQHGSGRGYVTPTARVAPGTSWNPRWSEMYGPDAERAKRDKEVIAKAVETLREAEHVPPALERAKEIVHTRSLAAELEVSRPDTQFVIVDVLIAYFAFLAWRNRDDEAIATAILMVD